jgi:hypothetical protein
MIMSTRNRKKARWTGAALIAIAVASAVPGHGTAGPVGKGAAVGAGAGALVGAIAGGRPLRGAAAGAATGAIVGAISK